MRKMIKTIFVTALVMTGCVSCLKDDDRYDEPENSSYVTVSVEGDSYFFVSDGKKKFYPGDISRIGAYDTKDKDGKRAYIYFNFLEKEIPGFEYNVALYGVADILSKEVEVAMKEEELEEAGDDTLTVHQMNINGEWLDINFSLLTEQNAKHKMTLLDNRLILPPADMPSGYQYLEFRQNAGGATGLYRGYGNVSYNLNGYHPSITGKKGLYIRVNAISSGIKYYKIDYIAPDKKNRQYNNLSEQNIMIE